MTATVKARVRRGAKLLDRDVPGWAERIDPDELDQGSCVDCILGQLFENYVFAPDHLASAPVGWQLGFDIERDSDDFAPLTDAWRAEVLARQSRAREGVRE